MDEIFDANEARKLTKQAIRESSPENLKKIRERIIEATKRKEWNTIISVDLLDSYTIDTLRKSGYDVSEVIHDSGDGPCRPAWDYRRISWKQ